MVQKGAGRAPTTSRMSEERIQEAAMEVVATGRPVGEFDFPEGELMRGAVSTFLRSLSRSGSTGGMSRETLSPEVLLAQLNQTITTQYEAWTPDPDVFGATIQKPALDEVLGSFTDYQFEIGASYEAPYLLMIPVLKEKKDPDDPDVIIGCQPVIADGRPSAPRDPDDDEKLFLRDRLMAKTERRAQKNRVTREVTRHASEIQGPHSSRRSPAAPGPHLVIQTDPRQGAVASEIWRVLYAAPPASRTPEQATWTDPGEEGMTKKVWRLLHAAALEAGKPIDRDGYSILDGDFDPDTQWLPFAGTRGHDEVTIYHFTIHQPYAGRFRSMVRGRVLSV